MPRKSDKELEDLEFEYLQQIDDALHGDVNKMINWLNTKDTISSDWLSKFNRIGKQKKSGELARGAERVFYALIGSRWKPNSAPIGADMFFENHNAYIHIDIKTARKDNGSDFRGIVPVGQNQTSYKPTASNSGTIISTTPNLPEYYVTGLPCLTYVVQLIYEPSNLKTIAVLLVSIPNGQLHSIYGNGIANSGKSKDESFRYNYKKNPDFQTIASKPKRVRFLYHDSSSSLSKEDITSRTDIV